MQRGDLPSGTITFLFTDIEGSTRLLRRSPDGYEALLERHRVLVRTAISRRAGVEVGTEGDSFFCVFTTAPDALAAAIDIQRSLAGERWPEGLAVKVRIGVHTGVAAPGGDGYVGIDVHRAARISETGHGGQVLVSGASRLLGEAGLTDGVTFLDLGEFQLRDLDEPEHLFQLVIDDLESAFPLLRKLDSGPTNLPSSASSFVGREREAGDVEKLLGESRLVTITGVGGAGKSRLAVEVANNSRGSFHDGIWLVELAPVSSDDLVARAVANALGLQESPGRVAEDVLMDYLREGKRLLVLDNCERVLGGVRDLVNRLVSDAHDLRILATSQQVLGVAGETRYPCPPLKLPSSNAVSPSDVLESDSVALFEVRAREVDPRFIVSADNASVIAAICRRLDGMPLAIELAAALVRIIPPEQILARLDDRFALLTGGPRTAPIHQQTLRAALDSTFDLLDEDRQDFAIRIGVFVGGFDAAAAEAVATGDDISLGQVIDGLSALVDRSLITSTQTDGAVRLTISESVRQFLLSKLDASGQLDEHRQAHARHFFGCVAAAATELRGPDQDRAGSIIHADIENIRAAISFLAETGDEAALQLVNRMFLYWTRRGDWSDGLHWTRLALEATQTDDSPLRARMLSTAGFFASDLGDGQRGIKDLEEGLAMARRTGDVHAEGYCSSFLGAELSRRDLDLEHGIELLVEAKRIYEGLDESYGEAWVNRYLSHAYQERGDLDASIRLQNASYEAFLEAGDSWNIRYAQSMLGEAMHTTGELDRSRELYDESMRGSADTQYKVVIAHALKGLGKVSLAEGKLDEAADHLREAVRELREIGDVACTAESRGHMAMVKLGRGHPTEAEELLVASLRTFREIQDHGGISWSLERLASVAHARGSHIRAATLLSAGAALRYQSGSMRPQIDRLDFDRLTSDVTDKLGQDAFDDAAQIGAKLDFDQALTLGLDV